MTKRISEQLADLSAHAKSAEDAFDAANKKAHDKVMALQKEARTTGPTGLNGRRASPLTMLSRQSNRLSSPFSMRLMAAWQPRKPKRHSARYDAPCALKPQRYAP
jgi:hypothetical protein